MSDSGLLDNYKRQVELAAQGDPEARNQLIEAISDRLRRIARTMLRQYPGVRRWEETDDIWQTALLRLWKSLEHVELKDARHFLNLATLQIRRALVDLARRYSGPQGMGRHHATPEPGIVQDFVANETPDANRLLVWTEIHDKIDQLPVEDREVFELIWYQGLKQAEVAELLDVSTRTVKRRWQSARLQLHDHLHQTGDF